MLGCHLKKQILIVACIYLGIIVAGYNAGWSAPTTPILVDPKLTPLPEAISANQASWLASGLFIGSLLGSVILGYYSNLRGRRPCFICGGVLTIVSLGMMLAPINFTMLLVARILVGYGLSIIYTTGIIYLGEIASTSIRGIVLSGITVSTSLGTLFVYCVGPYVSYQICIGIDLIMVLFFTIGTYYVPESPMYEILKGEEKKATDILTSLGRAVEIDSLIGSKTSVTAHAWMELFTVRSNRRALLITVTLGALQHLSGGSAILFFATSIFGLVGSSIDPNISTIAIGSTLFIASTSTPLLIERCGRRILLLCSTAACFLALTILGAYFYMDTIDSSTTKQLYWLPLASLVAYFLSYNAGFSTVTATLMGEMFEPNVRSIGATIAITVSFLSAFIVSTTFSSVMSLSSFYTFWSFATSCALAFFFTVFFVPETKGKTLAEIQFILSK